MASACVNNSLPLSPLPPDLTPSSDFEFCFHHQPPVPMLPADQLFSQGFLLPLPLPLPSNPHPPPPPPPPPSDPTTLFSPKAPRSSSRWRDLLCLKNLPSITPTPTSAARSFKHFLHRSSKSAGATLSSSSDSSPLLNHSDSLDFPTSTSSRPSLSSSSSSSSSSQAYDHDDLPRLSLDSVKTRPPRIRSLRPRSDGLLPYLDNNCNCTINGRGTHPVAASNRMGRSPIQKSTTAAPGTGTQPDAASRGVSVDSPRMNSSGRVVFQSLERSSSSPSSFNNGGGQRLKHRGVERSYSAGVRITPVLNVPISTLRSSTGGSKSGGSSGVFGLGQLFVSSPQKKEKVNGGSNVGRCQRSNNNGKSSSCCRG